MKQTTYDLIKNIKRELGVINNAVNGLSPKQANAEDTIKFYNEQLTDILWRIRVTNGSIK